VAGLQVADVTDPRSPKLLGSIDTPGDAFDVATDGSFVYVVDGLCGLQIAPVQR